MVRLMARLRAQPFALLSCALAFSVSGCQMPGSHQFATFSKETVGITDSTPSSIPTQAPSPIPAPVDWWKFDQSSGTTATDSAGNNPGTLANGVVWTSGQSGNALSVGSSSFPAAFGSGPSVTFPVSLPSNFTLYFWVNPSGFGNAAGTENNFLLGGETYQTKGFRSGFSNSGVFKFWTTESGGTLTLNDTQPAPIGSWTQFVISYQNGFASLFRNGIYIATASGTYIPGTSMGLDTGVGGVNTFWGSVDDLRIYNQALTPTEISSGQFNFGTFGSASNSLLTTFSSQSNAAISPSYFGMTIHHLASGASTLTPFPSFPIQTLRLWDVTYWAQLEPSAGQFDWTNMDGTIATGKQNGVTDFIFTLGHVPSWASTNPSDSSCSEGNGSCDFPNLSAMNTFLTTLVQRYCGTVKYYETWNEPDGTGFWVGTNSQLLSVAAEAYQIIKNPANCGCTDGVCSPGGGINPNQVILSPVSSLTPYSLSWLASYLASVGGAYPYADIAGFHGYGYPNAPEGIVQDVSTFKQLVSQYGLGGVPIWNTENSWGTSTTSTMSTQTEQAGWLMRYFTAQATSGVSRVVWYAYDNCAWGTLWGAACDPNNTGTPLDSWSGLRYPGTAFGTLENWLTGNTLSRCEQYQNGLWACLLQGQSNYTSWIFWSSTGSSITIARPAGFNNSRNWQNTITPLTGTIVVGQNPILIEN